MASMFFVRNALGLIAVGVIVGFLVVIASKNSRK